jgi:hypothetical protein
LIPGLVVDTIILEAFTGETKRQAFDDASAKYVFII